VPGAPAAGPSVAGPPASALDRLRDRLPDGRRGDLVILAVAVAVVAAVVAVISGAVTRGSGPPDGPAATATPTLVARAAITVTASSTQKAESGIGYGAANTLDGDPTTAWNSDGAKDGAGPGITLTYTFASPVDLRAVTVSNGYQKVRQSAGRPALDLWRLNARVHRVLVVTDTGRWTWDLDDARTPQTLSRNFGRTATLRLAIASVYRSDRYRDVAICEVSFRAA
jgi:hypothetical protein